jgi:hypothetical protein
MKKQFYLLMAGLLLVCTAHAQLKKGDFLLGGNVNVSKQTNSSSGGSSSDQTGFSFSPSIGMAVTGDLLLGLNLGYSYNKSKIGEPAYISNQNGYGLAVFVRKYKALGAGFALFAEGDLGGTYQVSSAYTDGTTKPPSSKSYTINAGFYPGVAYFITRHVQLETGLQNMAYIQYDHTKSGADATEVKSNSFTVGTSLNQVVSSIVIGFKWVI